MSGVGKILVRELHRGVTLSAAKGHDSRHGSFASLRMAILAPLRTDAWGPAECSRRTRASADGGFLLEVVPEAAGDRVGLQRSGGRRNRHRRGAGSDRCSRRSLRGCLAGSLGSPDERGGTAVDPSQMGAREQPLAQPGPFSAARRFEAETILQAGAGGRFLPLGRPLRAPDWSVRIAVPRMAIGHRSSLPA